MNDATTTLTRAEALTNIARHSGCTQASIALQCQSGEWHLRVQDNGVGFNTQSMCRDDAFGLLGIRERATMLGGEMEVGNLPGGGGYLAVSLPQGADHAAGGAAGMMYA